MVGEDSEGTEDSAESSAEGFASHAVRVSWVLADAKARRLAIADELRRAFAPHIESLTTEWIRFETVTADALKQAFLKHPMVVKPITAICNIAGRAITRDLGFTVDTYEPKLTTEQADQLAGYVKPFLPPGMALPAIEAIDDWFYIDKEIRAYQGRWERLITDSLTKRTGKTFKKRKFPILDESGKLLKDAQTGKLVTFELDAAHPPSGEPIVFGIDVKRIGSSLDTHKRVDEIVNKAAKFKARYPNGKFGAVVYYPFDSATQSNITNRMRSSNIDGVVFPPGDSPDAVERAILLLIPQLGLEVVDNTDPPSLFDQIS